jgi:hypothetical protein
MNNTLVLNSGSQQITLQQTVLLGQNISEIKFEVSYTIIHPDETRPKKRYVHAFLNAKVGLELLDYLNYCLEEEFRPAAIKVSGDVIIYFNPDLPEKAMKISVVQRVGENKFSAITTVNYATLRTIADYFYYWLEELGYIDEDDESEAQTQTTKPMNEYQIN